jgi:hypothetical protein
MTVILLLGIIVAVLAMSCWLLAAGARVPSGRCRLDGTRTQVSPGWPFRSSDRARLDPHVGKIGLARIRPAAATRLGPGMDAAFS